MVGLEVPHPGENMGFVPARAVFDELPCFKWLNVGHACRNADSKLECCKCNKPQMNRGGENCNGNDPFFEGVELSCGVDSWLFIGFPADKS